MSVKRQEKSHNKISATYFFHHQEETQNKIDQNVENLTAQYGTEKQR